MPLNTLNQFEQTVSDLPDKPNTQMSAAELKATFDAAAQELRQHTNANTNVLKSTTAGDSGAENIGSANISGIAGTTAHAQIKDVFNQLQSVVLGQIPNKSITRDKFADGAVDFSPVQLEIANLNLQLAASQLVPSGKTYGWDPKTSFGVIVDFTKGKTTAQLNAGDTSLEGKVTMSQGTFVAGKKVTVIGRKPADDSIVKEQATITSVSPLTISPLVNSYKSGAWIKRSTANNTTNGIKFGGVDDSVIKTVTDATVANQALDTSGNGGRKLVELSNGTLVSVVYDSTNYKHIVKKSTDNGLTWTDSCYVLNNSSSSASGRMHASLSVKDTTVYLFWEKWFAANDERLLMNKIDIDSQTNVDISSSAVAVDSSQTNIGGITSINTDSEMLVACHSKNSTYPNSFNIRYAKGTINADGSVTWGAVEQVTTVNNSSYPNFATNPSIVLDKNGIPCIFISQSGAALDGTSIAVREAITLIKKDSTLTTGNGNVNASWSYKSVYIVQTYTQSSPSAIFVPQSVNGLANGRIWVAWHGTDSTDTAVSNTRISYSDDGGVTWSAMQKLTSGNTTSRNFPSITANKSGKVFVLVINQPSGQVEQLSYDGTWSGLSVVASAGQGSVYTYPSALFDLTVNFTAPLFIYKTTAKVGFYGTWTIGTEAPITENILRLTLTQQAKEVMTYLHHTAGLTATAQVNGNVMDKTTTAEETQFTRVLGSLQDIEIEITLTRASVNDDITIDKILGGVA